MWRRLMANRERDQPRRWTSEQGAWVVFKLFLGVGWPIAMFFSTPASIAGAVGVDSINIWTIGTLVGGIVSIVGMIVSTSHTRRTALTGFHVELIGIALLAGGPVQYLLLQIGFLATPDKFGDRIALAFFAAAMVAAISARGVGVIRARRARASTLILGGE